MEQAGLLALQMLEDALSKQEMFSQLLRETSPGQSGSNLLVTPLDQLLLSVNSRTSQPDYFLHIAKFLSMPHCRPDLALIAVKILGWAVQSPSVHNKLVAILSSSDVSFSTISPTVLVICGIRVPSVHEFFRDELASVFLQCTSGLYFLVMHSCQQLLERSRATCVHILCISTVS